MTEAAGRVPDGTGLSQAEPESGLDPAGFDPSRGTGDLTDAVATIRESLAAADERIDRAIAELEAAKDHRSSLTQAIQSLWGPARRPPAKRGKADLSLLPFIPVGRADAAPPRTIWGRATAAGIDITADCARTRLWRMNQRGTINCVDSHYYRDSDEHRNGEDAQQLSGEAMPARAVGIAQGDPS